MTCPRCQSKTSGEDIFCARCGFDLRKAAPACPACGTLMAPGDIFCASCGVQLTPGAQAAAPSKVMNSSSPVEKLEPPPAGTPRTVHIGQGTVLSHGLIRQLAATHEYNKLSPLFALSGVEKIKGGTSISIDSGMLSAILLPARTFCLTARAAGNLYQEILLAGGPTCYRWSDRDGTVVVNREPGPRNFIEHIYGSIARDIKGNGSTNVILAREEIPVLKAIASLCSVLTLMKVRKAFTTFGWLQQMLKSADGLKGQLATLSQKGLVSLAGTGDPIVRLTEKGKAMVSILEDYDAFYTLQVLTGDHDEFASVYLVVNSGSLYLLTNPDNGDEVVVRTMDGAGLRSVLNWMWTAGGQVK